MKVLLAIGLIMVLILALSGGGHSTLDQNRDPCTDSVGVKYVAEEFIERILKAPSTASFSYREDTQVKSLKNCSFYVRGYVDSQNSFGAMIRNQYAIIVQYDGQSAWRAEYVTTNPSSVQVDVDSEKMLAAYNN